MSREQLVSFKNETEALYNDFKAQGLCLNMSRGNPCKEQLDLSLDMLNVFSDGGFMSAFGAAVTLQLLAYECAYLKGLPIDQPRNLAKSVTVE